MTRTQELIATLITAGLFVVALVSVIPLVPRSYALQPEDVYRITLLLYGTAGFGVGLICAGVLVALWKPDVAAEQVKIVQNAQGNSGSL